MRGTVVGDWMTAVLGKALLRLGEWEMPEHTEWEGERARVCTGECWETYQRVALTRVQEQADGVAGVGMPAMAKLAEDCFECPVCKGGTRQSWDGKRVNKGRYFYGLAFHDPNYKAGRAIVGKDCSDRTFGGGAVGQTVEEAEAAGKLFGLERYQAFYSASSKFPTRRHRVPSFDGACGFGEVVKVLAALGLALKRLDRNERRSSGPEIYEVVRC